MTSSEKRRITCNSKYHVDNVSKLEEVQRKRRSTFESKSKYIFYYQVPKTKIIDGSELEVYKLQKSVADDWLTRFHPFGAPKGNILSLGLVKNDTVFCIMTFKKSRNASYMCELSRLGMLPEYNIIRGYDILSQTASELGLYNIVAYVNRSFENIHDYESIGMRYARDIQKTHWWIKGNHRISDASRREQNISKDDLLSDGWDSVFDCGTAVYEVQ